MIARFALTITVAFFTLLPVALM
ncbi:Protein of unknown function [Bacillus wiedmannii]|nr:Protein of unknown function [Bacillus wiedmannii]